MVVNVMFISMTLSTFSIKIYLGIAILLIPVLFASFLTTSLSILGSDCDNFSLSVLAIFTTSTERDLSLLYVSIHILPADCTEQCRLWETCVIPMIFGNLLLYLRLFLAWEKVRMSHFGTKNIKTLTLVTKKTYCKLINILILCYYIANKNHIQTKLPKEDKFIIVIIVPHSNNEAEYLKISERGLENKIKLLTEDFKDKLTILEKQNGYKDEQIKLLCAKLEKIVALYNHFIRADARDKVWVTTAEQDDIINNTKKLSKYILVTNEAFNYMLTQVEKWLDIYHNTKL